MALEWDSLAGKIMMIVKIIMIIVVMVMVTVTVIVVVIVRLLCSAAYSEYLGGRLTIQSMQVGRP